jgi:hypothetical protein
VFLQFKKKRKKKKKKKRKKERTEPGLKPLQKTSSLSVTRAGKDRTVFLQFKKKKKKKKKERTETWAETLANICKMKAREAQGQ